MYLLFSGWVRTTIYGCLPKCLYIVLTVSNNKHSNIHFQFLSLCRLQQLAMTSRLTVVLVSLLLATAIVIFWLWLVIVPATVAQPCPLECKCGKAAYSVICSGPSITALPLIRYKNVQGLFLTENKDGQFCFTDSPGDIAST